MVIVASESTDGLLLVKNMKRIIGGSVLRISSLACLWGLASIFLTGCAGFGSADRMPLSAEEKALNVESFDYVWKAIADSHWDIDKEGLDWNAAKEEYRPRVKKARTMFAARVAMTEMIELLGQSHFGIIPRDVYEDVSDKDDDVSDKKEDVSGKKDEGSEDNGQKGETGLVLRIVDGQVLVTSVYPDYPAEELGVKPGWVILDIDDKELAPVVDKVSKAYADDLFKDFMLARAVNSRLNGEPGESVNVKFLDGNDKEVVLALPLAQERGKSTKFGNMPEMHVWMDIRKIDGNIGYFYLNNWADPVGVSRAFEKCIKESMGDDGFIIDLRGNPGGIGGMAPGIAGWFIDDEKHYLGTMHMRNSDLKFIINPRLETYSGPLAILIDGLSASTSEIFAGGLKDLKRARVFGTRSAGAALPSQVARLANGDGFQFAIANYISAAGEELEGIGVIPDEEVRLDRASLLAGKDPVIDAAVKWIRSQKK